MSPAAPSGSRPAEGVHLSRADEGSAGISVLAELVGGRVGLGAVLDDLDRHARRSWAPGRAVSTALTWDRDDRRTPTWWPQGISSSADASDSEEVGGRRMLAVSWYAKRAAGTAAQGTRVTFLDLDAHRYRHVLLVVPRLDADGNLRLEPLRVHAGGIVWCGRWLHVAATGRGFLTCRLEDLLRVPDGVASGDASRLGVQRGRISTHGYRYLLPVRLAYRADAEPGHERLRYSFLSLDRGVTPPELVVGEYGRGRQTRRLARFALDPATLLPVDGADGLSRPVSLDDGGVAQAQGAVVARGRYHLTVSHGRTTPGSVYVGRPGSFRRHRWAAPMGPEDLSYWPSTDLLWSVSEHPGRRWVFAMRRSRFD
jgi:hypothetical protein